MNHRLPDVTAPMHTAMPAPRTSVFAWPAWLRMLAVLPACALLWLGVCWALA